MSMIVMNLETPKVGAKQGLLFNKQASGTVTLLTDVIRLFHSVNSLVVTRNLGLIK